MKMNLFRAALLFLGCGTLTHSISETRFLSDDVLPKYFIIKSFLSSYQEEWCVEVEPSLGNIVINYCDIDNKYQQWTFDDNSHLRSLSDLNGCLVVNQSTNSPSVTPSINSTSALDINFEGSVSYAELCNVGGIDQSEVFVYNPFDNTISNMMMFLTVQSDPSALDGVNLYSKSESCLIAGQRWVLQSLPNENEIKFLGDPCSDLDNGCPLCSGDCDDDSDCAPGLRCAQRYDKEFFRQNVPGCEWKYPNDPERFYQADFCKCERIELSSFEKRTFLISLKFFILNSIGFQPISAPGVVNSLGVGDSEGGVSSQEFANPPVRAKKATKPPVRINRVTFDRNANEISAYPLCFLSDNLFEQQLGTPYSFDEFLIDSFTTSKAVKSLKAKLQRCTHTQKELPLHVAKLLGAASNTVTVVGKILIF